MPDVVPDTHSLIWHLEDSPCLGPAARKVFESCHRGEIVVYVPTICLVEIIYLQEKGRILADMKAQLDAELAGPSEEEIAASEAAVPAAEADVWSASADLEAVYDVSEADIMAAEVDLADAQEQQQSAHNTWVLLADCEEDGTGRHSCVPVDNDRMETITQKVQSANAQVAIAQALLDKLRDPDANSIASAQASLAAAVAHYDALPVGIRTYS